MNEALVTLTAQHPGKKEHVVEIHRAAPTGKRKLYHIKVDGVWFPDGQLYSFTKKAVKEMFFRSLKM